MHHFWQYVHQCRVLAFNGAMAAGKTTFIHRLCRYLGVQDAVSSPTFALINEYHFQDKGADRKIYHMDWYRLRDAEEAVQAGMEDALHDRDAYCFVEWPEKAEQLLPFPHMWIHIEATGAHERTMTLILKG